MFKDVPKRNISVKYTGLKVYCTAYTGIRCLVPQPKIDFYSDAAHSRCSSEQMILNSTVLVHFNHQDFIDLDLPP
jgi:hypothetical protein